jgi:hypothetical protein
MKKILFACFLISSNVIAKPIIDICKGCTEMEARNKAFQLMTSYEESCNSGELNCGNSEDKDSDEIGMDQSTKIHIFTNKTSNKGHSYLGRKSANGMVSVQPLLSGTPNEISEYFEELHQTIIEYREMMTQAQIAIDDMLAQQYGKPVSSLTIEDAYKFDNKITNTCETDSNYNSPFDYFKNSDIRNHANDYVRANVQQHPGLNVQMERILNLGAALGQSNAVNVSVRVLFEREDQVLSYTFHNGGTLTYVVEETPAGQLMPNLSLVDSTIGSGASNPDRPLSEYVTETSPNNYEPVSNQSSESFDSECLKKDWEDWIVGLVKEADYEAADGGDWPSTTCQRVGYDSQYKHINYKVWIQWAEQRGNRVVLVGKWVWKTISTEIPSYNPCSG